MSISTKRGGQTYVKKILSITLAAIMLLGMSTSTFATDIPISNDENLPRVNYLNDINGYDEFIFNSFTRGTSVPSSK